MLRKELMNLGWKWKGHKIKEAWHVSKEETEVVTEPVPVSKT